MRRLGLLAGAAVLAVGIGGLLRAAGSTADTAETAARPTLPAIDPVPRRITLDELPAAQQASFRQRFESPAPGSRGGPGRGGGKRDGRGPRDGHGIK